MKKIHWASGVHIAARVMSMISALLGVYIFTRLFSVEEFGYWSWLLSVSVMITSQDFGILSAMRVWLGKEYASQNETKQKSIFAAGFVGVSVIFILVLFGLLLYAAQPEARGKTPLLIGWVILASVFSIFGTVAANALLAFLHAVAVGLIELLRSIFQIVVILLASLLGWDFQLTVGAYYSLFVVYVLIVIPLLCFINNWRFIDILSQGLRNLPDTFNTLWSLVKNGLLLWVNQLAYVTILSADVFLAGMFLTQSEVAAVAVINKLIGLGVGLVGAGLLPYFGLYVHKLSSHDSSWVRIELKKAITMICLVSFVYTVVLLYFGKYAIFIWSGFDIDSFILYLMAGLQFGTLSLLTYFQLYFQGPKLNLEILPIVLLACVIRVASLWLLVGDYGIQIIFFSSVLSNGALVFMLYRKLIRSLRDSKEMVLMW